MRGAPERGARLLLDAVAAYDEGRAARDRCLTMTSLAWVYLSAGALDRAERTVDEAIAMANAIRVHQGLAWATHMRGMILMFRGRHAEARELLVRAVEMFRTQRNTRQEGWALSALARVELECGDAARAAEHATRAIGLLSANPVLAHWAYAARALSRLADGHLDDALSDAKLAAARLAVLPWRLDRGLTARALAEVQLARGESATARAAIGSACDELRSVAGTIADETWRAEYLAMPDHAWLLARG
jgi:tetratricopeptide (TPR) repeat protein